MAAVHAMSEASGEAVLYRFAVRRFCHMLMLVPQHLHAAAREETVGLPGPTSEGAADEGAADGHQPGICHTCDRLIPARAREIHCSLPKLVRSVQTP